MKDITYNKMIHRFCVLKDKINLGLSLNDLDKRLIEILDEYDFLIDYIEDEQKERNKHRSDLCSRFNKL